MSNSRIKKSLEIVGNYTAKTTDRMDSFLSNPIQEDIKSVPGIGDVAKETLSKEGIKNTWQLIGKFCNDFDRDPEKFLAWLNEFDNAHFNNGYKKPVVRSITEKVALMFGDAT